MRVEPIVPDAAPAPSSRSGPSDAGAFAKAIDMLGSSLDGAANAEDAFASGRGTLLDAVYERAQADIAIAVAATTAQRIAGGKLNNRIVC